MRLQKNRKNKQKQEIQSYFFQTLLFIHDIIILDTLKEPYRGKHGIIKKILPWHNPFYPRSWFWHDNQHKLNQKPYKVWSNTFVSGSFFRCLRLVAINLTQDWVYWYPHEGRLGITLRLIARPILQLKEGRQN